jgi:hypothetical protein
MEVYHRDDVVIAITTKTLCDNESITFPAIRPSFVTSKKQNMPMHVNLANK